MGGVGADLAQRYGALSLFVIQNGLGKRQSQGADSGAEGADGNKKEDADHGHQD